MSRHPDTPNAPNGDSLIFVKVALEAQRDADLLIKLRTKRKPDTPGHDALWSGAYKLAEDSRRCISEALIRGQLLFCFPGTTVLQQGGAA